MQEPVGELRRKSLFLSLSKTLIPSITVKRNSWRGSWSRPRAQFRSEGVDREFSEAGLWERKNTNQISDVSGQQWEEVETYRGDLGKANRLGEQKTKENKIQEPKINLREGKDYETGNVFTLYCTAILRILLIHPYNSAEPSIDSM